MAPKTWRVWVCGSPVERCVTAPTDRMAACAAMGVTLGYADVRFERWVRPVAPAQWAARFLVNGVGVEVMPTEETVAAYFSRPVLD
jgi:hypothetical protein